MTVINYLTTIIFDHGALAKLPDEMAALFADIPEALENLRELERLEGGVVLSEESGSGRVLEENLPSFATRPTCWWCGRRPAGSSARCDYDDDGCGGDG